MAKKKHIQAKISRPKTSLTALNVCRPKPATVCSTYSRNTWRIYLFQLFRVARLQNENGLWQIWHDFENFPTPRYLPSWLRGEIDTVLFYSRLEFYLQALFRFTITNKAYSSTSSPTPLLLRSNKEVCWLNKICITKQIMQFWNNNNNIKSKFK